MLNLRSSLTLLAVAALLAACGGGDDGPVPEKITYSRLVVFGDSLSDVGSYATAGLTAATGGGRYTVNGAGVQLWVDRVAAAAKVPAPCAAQVGLSSVGPLAGFAQAPTNKPGCFGYAQGGARVTHPVGPGNVATLPGSSGGALGQLTVPVVQQIANHLAAAGGSFSGTDLVTVLAGNNDLFIQMATVAATVAAGGNASAAGQAATTAMGTAGAELAAYVKSSIVGKGAKRVVVVGMPDVSISPDSQKQAQSTRDLIQLLSFTFNGVLQQGLQGVAEVLYVDAYSTTRQWAGTPSSFGISNVMTTACNAAVVASALLCSPATTVTGDVGRYLWADGVGHPTPYGHELFGNSVIEAMTAKGWL